MQHSRGLLFLIVGVGLVVVLGAGGWFLASPGGAVDSTEARAPAPTVATDPGEAQGSGTSPDVRRIADLDDGEPSHDGRAGPGDSPSTPTWIVEVRVLDATTERPIPEVRLRVVDEDSEEVVREGRSDEQGRWITPLPTALLAGPSPRLECERPGFVFARRTLAAGSAEVVVRLEPGVPFRGRVVRAADGEGLAGVEVRARDAVLYTPFASRRRTDDEGRFRLPGLVPGQPFTLELHAEGHVSLRRELPAPMLDDGREHEFVLGAGGIVRGVVHAESAESAEGRRVAVEHVSAPSRLPAAWAACDDRGAFEIRGLEVPGRYRVEATNARRQHAQSELLVYSSADEVRVVELHLRAREPALRVHLHREDGAPVAGQQVVLVQHPSQESWGQLSDEDGVAAFDVLPPSEYDVCVRPPAARFRRARVAVEEGRTTELDLELPLGRAVQGVVVDEQDRPRSGVELGFWVEVAASEEDFINLPPRAAAEGRGLVSAQGTTDETGAFRLSGLEPTPGVLTVGDWLGFSGDSFDARVGSLELDGVVPGGEPLRIVLPSAARIVARLRPPPSTRRVACQVSIGTAGWFHDVPLDEDGTLELSFARTGRPLDLLVDPVEGAPFLWSELTLVAGQTLDLGTLVVEAGTSIEGRVVDDRGVPVVGAKVEVEREALWWSRSRHSDEEGWFRIEHLPAGPARWNVSAAGHVSFSEAIELDGARTRDVSLPRLAELHVHWTGPEGRPRAGEALVLRRLDETQDFVRTRFDAVTDAQGTAHFAVPPGRYHLEPEDGESFARREVQLPAGEESHQAVGHQDRRRTGSEPRE